jgi:hypothetical protein
MKTAALPVVTLAKVEYAVAAPGVPACFSAAVLIDGVKKGHVCNDGDGSGDHFFPPSLEKGLDRISQALPPIDALHDLPNNADVLVGAVLHDWLIARELKRALTVRLLFTTGNCQVYQTNPMKAEEMASVRSRGIGAAKALLPGAVEILNFLPFDRALEVYGNGARS